MTCELITWVTKQAGHGYRKRPNQLHVCQHGSSNSSVVLSNKTALWTYLLARWVLVVGRGQG